MKIYVALEGMLSDDSHRFDLKYNSYEDYQNAVCDDKINENLKNLINHMPTDFFEVILYSTTPENLRSQVNDLLISNNIFIDEIKLKKKGDFRPDMDVKISFFDGVDKDACIVLENNIKVSDELRSRGYLVFQT